MPFVKLDCGILDSTIWFDRNAREIFLTALLMAGPMTFEEPVEEIAVRSTEPTGWSAPPGEYGFVSAASQGIIRRAGLEQEDGLAAMERLAAPDENSRTPDFEGRRLIRVDGGYVVLNYMRYRDKDYTTAERSRRYRKNKKLRHGVSPQDHTVTGRYITQAEAEAYTEAYTEAEAEEEEDAERGFDESFWNSYPRKVGRRHALKAWLALSDEERILADEGVRKFAEAWKTRPQEIRFCPHGATWLNGRRWEDAPEPMPVEKASVGSHGKPASAAFVGEPNSVERAIALGGSGHVPTEEEIAEWTRQANEEHDAARKRRG